MRWKRGSRAFLRLPCAWLLLLLPLAAATGLGEEGADTLGRNHGTLAELPPSAPRGMAGDTRPPASGEDAPGRGRSSGEQPSRVSRTGRRLDEDEESRILWRGWLLVDEAPTRRKAHITPKSVFIAPVIRGEGNRGGGGGIPACAEGYRSDAMGRCHKVVRVNQEAHLNFLLQRLNALYREPSPPAVPAAASHQGDSGPLLVTIPLATNPPQDEDSEEEGDDVDLVVVVEAGMPKDSPGSMPNRMGLLGGEQVAAESQDDVVVHGTLQESDVDKFMTASAIDFVRNSTGAMGSYHGGDSGEQNGERTVNAHSQTHAEVSIEPVTHTEASNSTEDTNVRREVSGSVNPELPANENTNSSSKETSAFAATESKMNETNVDGAEDVNLANSHIYETTIIAEYSTTESNIGKVTESPEVLHKHNLEPVPNGNISEHNIEEVVGEAQKRVVFPGRVEERVRFPDTEERRPLYPLYPSTTASTETHFSTPTQPLKSTSRPWGAWNRPMLLKFWTQMPLVREPTHGPDSAAKDELPTASDDNTSSFAKQEESWSLPVHSDTQSKVHHGGPYQRRPWIYYQEMSPRDLASVSRVFDRVRHFESRG